MIAAGRTLTFTDLDLIVTDTVEGTEVGRYLPTDFSIALANVESRLESVALISRRTGDVTGSNLREFLDQLAQAGLVDALEILGSHDAESGQKSRSDRAGGDDTFDLVIALEKARRAILEAGGTAEFPGLFSMETDERVRARISLDGGIWLVFDSLGAETGHRVHSRESALAREGLYEKQERAPATALLDGPGHRVLTIRTDPGYPPDAVDWPPDEEVSPEEPPSR